MIESVCQKIRVNVQKVMVGKDEVINLAIVGVLCEGHILLEDVPGIGKTTLARALAASLGCTFRDSIHARFTALRCHWNLLVQPKTTGI